MVENGHPYGKQFLWSKMGCSFFSIEKWSITGQISGMDHLSQQSPENKKIRDVISVKQNRTQIVNLLF